MRKSNGWRFMRGMILLGDIVLFLLVVMTVMVLGVELLSWINKG